MTFIEWCRKGENDDRYLRIEAEGQVYEPGVEVPIETINHLKPMKIVGHPKLKDNVWQIRLKSTC